MLTEQEQQTISISFSLSLVFKASPVALPFRRKQLFFHNQINFVSYTVKTRD